MSPDEILNWGGGGGNNDFHISPEKVFLYRSNIGVNRFAQKGRKILNQDPGSKRLPGQGGLKNNNFVALV